MGAAGCIPADREFLHAAQSLARQHGALFIADEVMTFRLEYGGAQEHYGITPDLTTFAKIIGGGFPVGAIRRPHRGHVASSMPATRTPSTSQARSTATRSLPSPGSQP